MRSIMRSIVAATAVCLAPLTAPAAPVHYDFLTVEYEGTIRFIENNGGLGWATCCDPKIGDSVSGSLRVNLHNLPPDRFPSDPRRGDYSVSPAQPSYSVSFVRGGNWKPDTGPSGDRLRLEDGIGGRDFFEVGDAEGSRERGPFESRLRVDGLSLLASSTMVDFIRGDGPLQAFEITADQLDASSYGERTHARFDFSLGEFFGGYYRFAIDKLKVTPGRCMAP